ncbi:unnamed protein product [marine sediment metagenome]|uniref:Uncharacterized protein n=1 Tax=marine sediment metagenome TaxID=412755 RepID=X0UQ11_9ZZZZ
MAEITMSMIEYQELQSRANDAQKRCTELEKRIHEVEMTDPEDRIPDLVACIKAALPIVEFAVGNLAPETVRGWPYDELLAFAGKLETMPGVDTRLKEYALGFRSFIREAQEVETTRGRMDNARAYGLTGPTEQAAPTEQAETVEEVTKPT